MWNSQKMLFTIWTCDLKFHSSYSTNWFLPILTQAMARFAECADVVEYLGDIYWINRTLHSTQLDSAVLQNWTPHWSPLTFCNVPIGQYLVDGREGVQKDTQTHFWPILCHKKCSWSVCYFERSYSQDTIFRWINAPGMEADNEPLNLSNFNEIYIMTPLST